ncbi:MAG: hypothetical protein AAFN05_07825, partial [Pseudomonadota bacterium]
MVHDDAGTETAGFRDGAFGDLFPAAEKAAGPRHEVSHRGGAGGGAGGAALATKRKGAPKPGETPHYHAHRARLR